MDRRFLTTEQKAPTSHPQQRINHHGPCPARSRRSRCGCCSGCRWCERRQITSARASAGPSCRVLVIYVVVVLLLGRRPCARAKGTRAGTAAWPDRNLEHSALKPPDSCSPCRALDRARSFASVRARFRARARRCTFVKPPWRRGIASRRSTHTKKRSADGGRAARTAAARAVRHRRARVGR